MALTTDELAWVRARIGAKTPPTNADLDVIHERVGTPAAVVTEVLEARLADLVASPAQFSIPGDYSQNVGDNIAALRKQIAEVAADPFGGGGVTITEPCNLRDR